jgi:hypothetical protein
LGIVETALVSLHFDGCWVYKNFLTGGISSISA